MPKSMLAERLKIWRKILAYLEENDESRHDTEIAKAVGITVDIAYYRLKSMAAEGLVEMLRKPWGILWRITEKGKQWLKEPE